MENVPSVSVVIPAFNEEECIEECVREVVRVMRDLGRSFEIIVVDDGSTDETPPTEVGLRASRYCKCQ